MSPIEGGVVERHGQSDLTRDDMEGRKGSRYNRPHALEPGESVIQGQRLQNVVCDNGFFPGRNDPFTGGNLGRLAIQFVLLEDPIVVKVPKEGVEPSVHTLMHKHGRQHEPPPVAEADGIPSGHVQRLKPDDAEREENPNLAVHSHGGGEGIKSCGGINSVQGWSRANASVSRGPHVDGGLLGGEG